MRGWRYGVMHPDCDTIIYSPWGTSWVGGACAWESPVLRATCRTHPDHTPPAPGCSCGVYAVANVVDILYRVANLSMYYERLPAHPDWQAPVLCQVEVENAVLETSLTMPHLGDVVVPELRGTTARIERLWVPERPLPAGAAPRIAKTLADTYGVPAVAGAPPISARDWGERPAWVPQGFDFSTHQRLRASRRDLHPRHASPALGA